MRCPNCGRNNTSERLFCVNCAAELVPEIAEQFEPPRARTRRRRQAREVVQTIHTGVTRFDASVNELEARVRQRDRAEVRDTLRQALVQSSAVVPGLAHLILGERRLGRWLLASAFLSLAVWLGCMGSALGTLGIYAFASLLISSVIDAARLQPGGRRAPFRIRFALLGITYFFFCWMLGTQVLSWGWDRLTVNIPIRIVGTSGETGVLFHQGDHVLVYKRAYLRSRPQRGDIVYATEATGAEDVPSLERIIGVPGDEVAFARGKLTVNGEAVPADRYPLQPRDPILQGHDGEAFGHTQYGTNSWSGTVSEGHYLVWGVDLPANRHDVYALPTVGPREITPDQIAGKGWILYSPYSHRKLL